MLFFRELAHTVTRVCQRSLHSHESFFSYFIFFLKFYEADLLLIRNIFVPTFAKNCGYLEMVFLFKRQDNNSTKQENDKVKNVP